MRRGPNAGQEDAVVSAIECSIPQEQLFDVLLDNGPLTASEIGARLGVSEAAAWACARFGAQAGYLDRDEFGRFAPWCAWPRVGL
jgi:hypothetical protein